VEKETFAATRHVPWAQYTSKMRLWPKVSYKCIFGLFRAQGTCLVAANVVLFVLNQIYKLKQMWLYLYVLYVTV